MPFHVEPSDLLTILILIGLEGILSGDNALVLAVLVLPLPEEEQRRALRYGIIGAYVLRTIATFLAVLLSQLSWIALVGGLYLIYLPYKHFTQHPDEEASGPDGAAVVATGLFGLSVFWSTVVRVELTDLVFAVDSILVAVAMSKKEWVIIAGGILGLTMMRLLTMQVLALIKTYPKLIDGAYIIVAWVGVKLLWEYAHKTVMVNGHHAIPELPKAWGIGIVVALFIGSFLYARAHKATEDAALVAAANDCQDMLRPGDRRSPDAPTDGGRPPGAA